MIGEHLTIIQAWNELNKINNDIQRVETLMDTRFDVGASKLKDVLVKSSIVANDKFINSIVANDNDRIKLDGLYNARNAYETYIRNEIIILKLSQPVICVAFLKEYYLNDDKKRMTWKDIAKEMKFSIAQCKRYYDEYKGKSTKDNSWCNDLSSQNEPK